MRWVRKPTWTLGYPPSEASADVSLDSSNQKPQTIADGVGFKVVVLGGSHVVHGGFELRA